jgi:hypothetical protein
MVLQGSPVPRIPPSKNLSERLELARELFEQFHAQCFWHSPRDLAITEDLIPFVAKGLRAHGGRHGFILAARLLPYARERESSECH